MSVHAFSIYIPANISTSDQRWNNVDLKLKMKQNPTLDFQSWYNVGVRSWNNVEKMLLQLYLDVVSMWPQH